jgi:hypothetical protein
VTEKIKEEIKTFLDSNENLNTTYQNLWDTAEAMQMEKFTTTSAYIIFFSNKQTNDAP